MISQRIVDEYHQREFGEEMARVNSLPKEQRWDYVRKLWAKLKLQESARRPHGPERIWGVAEDF